MTVSPAALLLVLLALLAAAPPASAGERVALHLKDGSVLKGELLAESPQTMKLRTSFGEVAIPRSDVAALYVEKQASAAAPGAGEGGGGEAPPAAPVKAGETGKGAPRIRDAGGAPPAAPPEALLTLEDEELINLLQKSDRPAAPERVAPEGAPGEPPQAPVKRIYTYESEKGNLLPPELTELELPKPKAPKPPAGADKTALDAAGKAVDAVVGGGDSAPTPAKGSGPADPAGTAEVKAAGGGEKPKAPSGDGRAAGGADAGTAEVKVFEPPKGTIDGKIHKQFKKHGALSVAPDDFREIKGNEIDSLLKKHLPVEGTAEINLKGTDEVKRDGK